MREASSQQRVRRASLLAAAVLLAGGLGWGPELSAQPLRATRSQTAGGGFTLEATLAHAAFDLDGAPSVIVHAGAGFDPARPLRLVVFLHGYSGCTRVLMGTGKRYCKRAPGARAFKGFGLAAAHDAAGDDSLLIVPQLAYMRRNGSPGRFGREAGFRRFLQELLQGPLSQRLERPLDLDDVDSIVLVAHSAGFQTALAVLEHGGLTPYIHQVVLLDALYDGVDRFARWLLADPRKGEGSRGRRLINIHLRGKPAAHSARLLARVRRRLGAGRTPRLDGDAFAGAVADPAAALVTIRGRGAHRDLPGRYLAALLGALPRP